MRITDLHENIASVPFPNKIKKNEKTAFNTYAQFVYSQHVCTINHMLYYIL